MGKNSEKNYYKAKLNAISQLYSDLNTDGALKIFPCGTFLFLPYVEVTCYI